MVHYSTFTILMVNQYVSMSVGIILCELSKQRFLGMCVDIAPVLDVTFDMPHSELRTSRALSLSLFLCIT